MAVAKALAAVLLLGVLRSAIGAPACVGSSTQFFGAPWDASLVDAEQESDYKLWGELVGAAVLFNQDSGCVQAVQGTYGPQVPATSTLGLQASPGSGTVLREELQLEDGEVFDYVEYKAHNCIAYLKLTTSNGRSLAVGDADAELSLQSNRPAAGSYLGFFKATLEPLDAESAAAAAAPVPTEGTTPLLGSGALKQLQLVWVRDCATVPANEEVADPVAPAVSAPAAAAAEQHAELHVPEDVPAVAAGAAAADTDALSPTWGDQGSDEELVTTDEAADADETLEAGDMEVPTIAVGSEEVSSGRDGSALRAATAPATCTAKQAAGFSDGSVPTSSCSLSGLGKEVAALSCFGTNLLPSAAVDAAGSLSPCSNLACKLSKEGCQSTGAFGVGSFCTGKVVAMGATAKLHSTAESYMGHPCIEVKDARAGLLAGAPSGGDYSAKGAYVAKSWKVCDCAAAGVTAQATQDKSGDFTIALPEMPTPRLTITTFPVEIKPPTFSLPTLNLPTDFSLPAPLQALAKIANFTALNLDLSDLNFTLPSLPTLQLDEPHRGLALLSSLPSILKFDRPVTNMSVPDVLAQWLAATVSKATLPRIVVPTARVNALKALIPGFTAPSVVMPTYLSAVLSKVPASLELPSFSIPGKTLPSVSLLLPNLTSLPSIVVPADMPKELRLPPLLTMHNVSLPTLQQLARNFVDSLPSVEVSFNVPDILAQWVAGVVQASPLQQLNVSDSGLVKLQELLPDMPDKGPALLLLNISSPFLAQPVVKELVNLPTVVIPDSLIGNVSAVLPTLTSLPSILLAKLPANLTMLPEVRLPDITVPGLRLTIDNILHNLPTTLNMTQGITDWLDTHTSLLGDAAEGSNASAAADVAGGLSLGAAHPMVGAGLAAAVEQLAGAGADVPVKAALGSGAPAAADDDAAAAGAPATAGDAAAAAAGAPAAAGDAGDAADAPVAAVAAGAPLEEAEVEAA